MKTMPILACVLAVVTAAPGEEARHPFMLWTAREATALRKQIQTEDWAKTAYPRTKNDIYAAFVERGIEILHPRAHLGAITSRTGFFLSSFQKWREEILLKEAPPVVVADLGYGVMDDAMVEAAAYCLEVAG